MIDHPLYRAILEALVWPYSLFLAWLLASVIRDAIHPPPEPREDRWPGDDN